MKLPVIGITSDRDAPASDIEAHYFLRRNYCDAIVAAGGVPLILPYLPLLADVLLDGIDALVVSGGMFDIDPCLYFDQEKYPGKMVFKSDRTTFEQAMLRGALARDMPVLGICGGMQLIAVELGGQLHQHLPGDVASTIEHKQAGPMNQAGHRISIKPDTLLREIVGAEHLHVNSLHHQAVKSANPLLVVSAQSDDGVVEAIEAAGRRFCVGVQWHPEYGCDSLEPRLFEALVRAACGAAIASTTSTTSSTTSSTALSAGPSTGPSTGLSTEMASASPLEQRA